MGDECLDRVTREREEQKMPLARMRIIADAQGGQTSRRCHWPDAQSPPKNVFGKPAPSGREAWRQSCDAPALEAGQFPDKRQTAPGGHLSLHS